MLSENIRELRKQKGYSQETFAQALNVVRQTVSKWEKGYSVPDAVMLEKMADVLDVSVGDLRGKGDGTPEAHRQAQQQCDRPADEGVRACDPSGLPSALKRTAIFFHCSQLKGLGA